MIAARSFTSISLAVYDGAIWTDALDLDIDHLIPLKEAWASGARSWTTERRRALANDLERPQLVAVTNNVNRAKEDKDPARWMPPLTSYRKWVTNSRLEVQLSLKKMLLIQVKHFYGLSVDTTEKAALTDYLSKC
ncbi:unnamed protein product [Rhizoctonia solani]|uniref:GmrSD restriction endonucleases C-terminal domain-containing protein n=1 Tax=Rhizoctonia solani TaxID=456999 RepID=A0A8H2Y477_9AGAM|nr:unnamed protein product [Rhizoctonia solani]